MFDSGTRTLSGTPQAGTGGVYSLNFTASNGVGSNSVQAFTLTVNEPAAITSANNVAFTVGNNGSFTVTTNGFPRPGITQGGATLPANVSFTNNGDGTATISGTPAAGTGGVYNLTLTAANGPNPAMQNFTLTVNEAPAITSANGAAFTVGTNGSFTVMRTGFPAPTLMRSGTLPTGVMFDTGTGVLSGTPAPGRGRYLSARLHRQQWRGQRRDPKLHPHRE